MSDVIEVNDCIYTVTGDLWDAVYSPLGGGVYYGEVYADRKARWPDGTYIHTSVVVETLIECEERTGAKVVRTLNNVYRVYVRRQDEPQLAEYDFGDKYKAN